MKKILLFFCFLCVIGCSRNVDGVLENDDVLENVVVSNIECSLDGSNFTLVLENGQIVKYIDEVDGELGQETIDILNSEHLVGVDDNDSALKIMNSALSDLGGYCK